MRLSTHFTLAEAIHSETATRKGIDNTPFPEILANMGEAADGMEQVRELLATPIFVSSWYRSPKLNAAIGGSATSAHVHGYAVDFTAPGFGSPIEVCEAIQKSNIKYDQLIYEGTWVHISFAPEMRQVAMSATFLGGRVTYSQGIAA